MKLDSIRLTGRSRQTVPLQLNDGIDEGGVRPGLSRSVRLRGGDDVRRRFFDDTEAVRIAVFPTPGAPAMMKRFMWCFLWKPEM